MVLMSGGGDSFSTPFDPPEWGGDPPRNKKWWGEGGDQPEFCTSAAGLGYKGKGLGIQRKPPSGRISQTGLPLPPPFHISERALNGGGGSTRI